MYFQKVLIANRGEIAVRIIRACRELGIATVAVYSDVDRAALHVRLADQAYPIGTAPATESYLHVERILDVAHLSRTDAIHPGYGFLSERAHFAQACVDAGLTFIGPSSNAINLMGSKSAAKALAKRVGVLTIPGYMDSEQRPAELRAAAERLGFPLVIKASAGGGGKGMRNIFNLEEFDLALVAVQREAQAAFGDSSVFLERLIEGARHVEIQVLADAYGNCVHLFERECSIQRRHQKIIEETPSPLLTPALREEMGAAAVRLAHAAGYRNAGTLEFLLDAHGQFYFLEMNTRLQVEHPITELVVGIDLVQLQIAIAAGRPLPFQQADLSQRGHAIEARICAEDPVTFLPSTGRIALFAPMYAPGIRHDAGVESGDEVTIYYDPLLAKLIVSAPDRAAAIARLQFALANYSVLGVTTNLPLLRQIAAHPDFLAGDTQIDFLATHKFIDPSLEAPLPQEVLVAAAISDVLTNSSPDPWSAGPWRLLQQAVPLRYVVHDTEQLVRITRRGEHWQVQVETSIYNLQRLTNHADQLTLQTADQHILQFRVLRSAQDLLIFWRGNSYRLTRASALSEDTLLAHSPQAHIQSSLLAPMPGIVLNVLVQEGQTVIEQQLLLVLEAMKMEQNIVAPYAGVVRRLPYQLGALVSKGVVLVELEPIPA